MAQKAACVYALAAFFVADAHGSRQFFGDTSVIPQAAAAISG